MEISTRDYYSRQQKIFYTYVMQRQSTVMVSSTPMYCRDNLLWWYLLHCSTNVWPDIHYPRICWWCHFPLVFSLLPKRDTATYNRFFTLLKNIAIRHNFNFSPTRVNSYLHISNCRTTGLSFSLRKGHLEKDSEMRTTNRLKMYQMSQNLFDEQLVSQSYHSTK